MHAGRHQTAGHRRARADRLGHRRGEGAALHAADRQPPPRPARSRDRRAAAAAGRPRDPAHAGRAAAGVPGGRDPRADRRRRRGAVRPRRAERRAGARGQLLVRDRLAHPAGGGRGASTCCAPARSTSRSSSATTTPSPNRRASACTTCSTIRCTCCPPAPDRRCRPCATPPGSPAATGAGATCWRCAPSTVSHRGSATPPTTWSSCRRWSSPGWA